MAGLAAAVAIAATRRKFRCVNIGHFPFMNIARPDPAAASFACTRQTHPGTDRHVRRFLVQKHSIRFVARVR